jgi:hypothetical protein
MMKKGIYCISRFLLTVIGFLFLSIVDIDAHEIKIKSFSLQMEPMTVPMQRKDNNGAVCALVKVIVPNEAASFEGNLIGQCDYKSSEYWCYLSPGSKQLKIKYPNCQPLMVNFESLIGESLRSKYIYELLLSVPDTDNSEINKMFRIINNIKQINPDHIGHKQGTLYPFAKDGKYGYLDANFNIKLDAIYTDIFNHGMFSCAIYDKMILSNKTTRKTDFWDQDFYWVRKDSVWGAINADNQTVIPFKYYRLYPTQEDYNACRFTFAMMKNSKNENVGYLIDLRTGETVQKISGIEERYCKNALYSNLTISRLLHIYTENNQDLFFDKYTGDLVKIHVPKGYFFRYFLPYNHLYFYSSSKYTDLIIDTNSRKIPIGDTRCYWPSTWQSANVSPQYFITNNGIFDLESEKYIFEKYSRGVEAYAVSSTIIQLFYEYGIHSEIIYFDLQNKSFSTEYPDLVSNKHNLLQPWQLAFNMISKEFGDKVDDVIELSDTYCMVVSTVTGDRWATAYTIVDKDGNYLRLLNGEVTQGLIHKYCSDAYYIYD